MSTDKKNILICIDTEFESSNVITGNCLQLAFTAFYEDYDVSDSNKDEIIDKKWIVDSKSFCFKDQGKEKEKRTMEFWSKFPEIREKIRSEERDVKECMVELQEWLVTLSEDYNISGFMADHSCIDFPWFRNLYMEHLDEDKPKIFLTWRCHCICNITDGILMANPKANKNDLNKFCEDLEMFPHTHYALDDVYGTAYYYLRLKLYVKNLSL